MWTWPRGAQFTLRIRSLVRRKSDSSFCALIPDRRSILQRPHSPEQYLLGMAVWLTKGHQLTEFGLDYSNLYLLCIQLRGLHLYRSHMEVSQNTGIVPQIIQKIDHFSSIETQGSWGFPILSPHVIRCLVISPAGELSPHLLLVALRWCEAL